MTDFEAVAYLEMLQEIAETQTPERLESAIKRAVTELPWFPTREQILELLPPVVSAARKRCGLCAANEGWLNVTVSKYGKEYPALKKCDHTGQRTFTTEQIESDYHRLTPKEAMEALAELREATQKKLADIFGEKKITPKSVVEAVTKIAKKL